MKNLVRTLLLVAAMIGYCGTTYAQKGNRQRITRDHLAEIQARHIAKELSMDDATAKKFIETYCQYLKELWALGPRISKQFSTDSSVITDEEAERVIKEHFARSQKILGIRQDYYNKYGQFLTQKQIQRMYELEKQMMKRLAKPRKDEKRNYDKQEGRTD